MTRPPSSASPWPTSGRKSCASGLRSASPSVPMRRARRMHALVQHVADGVGEGGRKAGGAAGDAGQPHEQRGAHFVGGEEVADADGARHHGLALEGRDLVLGERACRRRRRGRCSGHRRRDRPRRSARRSRRARSRRARDRRREADRRRRRAPPPRHRRRRSPRLPASTARLRRQRITPLAFRKAAATARGSFLSTSTWRLSSCIVGLSISAPTCSSASTALGLPATVSRRTTGARK